jgi:hypothetical protein
MAHARTLSGEENSLWLTGILDATCRSPIHLGVIAPECAAEKDAWTGGVVIVTTATST